MLSRRKILKKRFYRRYLQIIYGIGEKMMTQSMADPPLLVVHHGEIEIIHPKVVSLVEEIM